MHLSREFIKDTCPERLLGARHWRRQRVHRREPNVPLPLSCRGTQRGRNHGLNERWKCAGVSGGRHRGGVNPTGPAQKATTVTRKLNPEEEQEKPRPAGWGPCPTEGAALRKAQKQGAAAGEPWCVTSGWAGEAGW